MQTFTSKTRKFTEAGSGIVTAWAREHLDNQKA
jgi:hypothetical protein